MIKHCPICKSDDLDSEKSSERLGFDGYLTDAISYVCNNCGAEFKGISGYGLVIESEGVKPVDCE